MKIRTVLLLLMLTVSSFTLLSQEAGKPDVHRIEKNYRDYLEHFDARINRHRENSEDTSPANFYAHPERLPAWLGTTVMATPDSIFIAGISDPGMQPDQALRLAKHRAMIMLALTNGPMVANMRDNFSKESGGEFSELFAEYSDISAIINFPADKLIVSKIHFTQYGETVVLASIALADLSFAGEAGASFSVKAGLYSGLARSGRQMQTDERLELESMLNLPDVARAENHTYSYSSTKNILNTISTFNDTVVADLPALNFRYLGDDDSNSGFPEFNPDEMHGFSLRNGIWNAMLAAMLSHMLDSTHDESLHFRLLGDTYNASALRLTRQLTSTRAPSVRPSFIIHNNHLYITSK